MIRVHRPFATELFRAALVIDDQPIDDRFHERAKPPALGVGFAEIATHELQGELLKYFVGGIFVAKCRQGIPADGPAVAIEQPLLGRLHGRVVAVGLADHRPGGRDAADV